MSLESLVVTKTEGNWLRYISGYLVDKSEDDLITIWCRLNARQWPKMIEPYVLLSAPDQGIAADYAAYRDLHRDQLEKSLSQNPAADVAAESVLMQHLEGGPWQFLTVVRYHSWQDFATSEKNGIADTLKAGGGWLEVRNHSAFHNDTLTDRIAP